MAQPIANDDPGYVVDEDSILKVNSPVLGVLGNDTDADDATLAAYVNGFPSNPLFNFKTNGTFTYDARYHGTLFVNGSGELDAAGFGLTNGFDSLAAGATVTDTFTYLATDGQDSDQATVTVTITGVNDDPLAVDDFATFDQAIHSSILIDAGANDTDVDIYPVADTLTVTGIKDIVDEGGGPSTSDDDLAEGDSITTAEGGIVTFTGGQFQYEAADGFFGIDTFEYTVSDGKGGTDTGLVRVTVLPGNLTPVAVDDARTVTESEDGTTLLASVLGNDTDGDFEPIGAELVDPIATALRRVDAGGNTIAGDTGILVDFNADGTFNYDPDDKFESLGLGESAYVAFDYTAFDGKGASSTATVIIEIQGENDPPEVTAPADQTVYEAGLADGSKDGPVIIVRDYVITLEDPDSNPTIAFSTGATPDTSDQNTTHGTWSIIDNDSSDDQVVVRYTLTTNAQHPRVQGHNSDPAVADSIQVFVIDEGASVGSMTLQADIVDDINFLAALPDGVAGTVNLVDSKTVAFSLNATNMDTFSHYQGADGATLEILGIPNSITLIDGSTVSFALDPTDDLKVIGTRTDGDGAQTTFMEIVFDPESATNEGKYTVTMKEGPPTSINDLDFSALKAGGPEESPTVENINFDGGFFTNENDIGGTFADAPGTSSADDINPNNAGGIGIGNGNIERGEVLKIDVSASSTNVSGVEFDIVGVGGGIGEGKVLWEAWASGVKVDSGFFNVDLTNTTGVHTLLIDPDFAFDTVYIALDNDDFDGNDKARINRIATEEEILSSDIILPFRIRSTEDDEASPGPFVDGDVTAAVDFDITVDGPGTGDAIDEGLLVL